MLKSLKEATARYELELEDSREMCVLQEECEDRQGGERQMDGHCLQITGLLVNRRVTTDLESFGH